MLRHAQVGDLVGDHFDCFSSARPRPGRPSIHFRDRTGSGQGVVQVHDGLGQGVCRLVEEGQGAQGLTYLPPLVCVTQDRRAARISNGHS